MKICAKCGLEKPLSEFPKHRGKPLGVYSSCRPCKSLEAKANRERNGDKVRAASLDWYRRNPLRSKENHRAWNEVNRDRKAAHWQRWYASHGPRESYRYSDVRHATPPWADRFLISEIYRLARLRTRVLGYPWEVDHIIPINHPNVCGLHVPENLRVVPRAVNREKGNRLTV